MPSISRQYFLNDRIINEHKGVSGMKNYKENKRNGRKHAPLPHHLQQIPYNLTRARTRASTVGSRRLTAWAMTKSKNWLSVR
jgi:hypothetical protein